MKRLSSLIAILSLVVGVLFSQAVFAGADKVEYCHVKDSNINNVLGPTYYQFFGHVIEVSEKAAGAHDNHGDVIYNPVLHDIDRPPFLDVDGDNIPDWGWPEIADYWGYSLASIDCAGAVPL